MQCMVNKMSRYVRGGMNYNEQLREGNKDVLLWLSMICVYLKQRESMQ